MPVRAPAPLSPQLDAHVYLWTPSFFMLKTILLTILLAAVYLGMLYVGFMSLPEWIYQ